jgi:hypothetical protein
MCIVYPLCSGTNTRRTDLNYKCTLQCPPRHIREYRHNKKLKTPLRWTVSSMPEVPTRAWVTELSHRTPPTVACNFRDESNKTRGLTWFSFTCSDHLTRSPVISLAWPDTITATANTLIQQQDKRRAKRDSPWHKGSRTAGTMANADTISPPAHPDPAPSPPFPHTSREQQNPCVDR